MAFNPDPKVTAARDIGRKWSKSRVIVLMIDDDAGTIEYASWGRTPVLCRRAKVTADAVYEAVREVER